MDHADNLTYQSLDASRKETRVIEIQPSISFDDIITCTISTISLLDPPPYDALSWCWGTSPATATLRLNGREITYSKTLDTALRYLRDADKPISIWVDGLSISQDDLDDKIYQIPLMHEIFSQATTVQIWLGEPTDESDRTVRLLHKLVAGDNAFDKVDGAYLTHEQFEQLSALFKRPWWSRTWVVQELVLARRAVFHCGSLSFGFEEIQDWVIRVITEVNNASDGFIAHAAAGGFITTEMGSIYGVTEAVANLSDMIMLKHQGSSVNSINAIRILCEISNRQATDTRDKVFGALGLLDPIYTRIWTQTPGWYLKRTEVVHALTTLILIEVSRDLYAFCFLSERSQSDFDALSRWISKIEEDDLPEELRQDMPILPSWSIDFSKSSRKRESLNVWFDCTPKLNYVNGEALRANYPFIYLSGIPFDEIVKIHPVCTDLYDREDLVFLDTMRRLHRTWRTSLGINENDSTPHQLYVGGGSLSDAYWRTAVAGMCLDENHSIRRMASSRIKLYLKWLMQKGDNPIKYVRRWDGAGHGPAVVYAESLSMYLQLRSCANSTACFFVTRRGYIGLSVGRTKIAVGDNVYLFAHSDVPFVLRPMSQAQRKVLSVVCECYVDGIMDGQAFKDAASLSTKQVRQNELRRKIFGGSAPDPKLPLSEWEEVTLI